MCIIINKRLIIMNNVKSFFTAGILTLIALPFIAGALSMQFELGDQGTEVSDLQAFLARDSSIYPEGLVTGYFGPLTQAAVERYQCRENIVCSGDTASTGYGRLGPTTMARINTALGFGTGGSADASAPIVSAETVTTPATRTAVVAWTTNEEATSRVMYNTSWPFLYSGAPSASDTNYDYVQSVTIGNLTPNTLYYYVRESIDPSGNVTWTSPKTFVSW